MNLSRTASLSHGERDEQREIRVLTFLSVSKRGQYGSDKHFSLSLWSGERIRSKGERMYSKPFPFPLSPFPISRPLAKGTNAKRSND
jgi:hypothetical protein